MPLYSGYSEVYNEAGKSPTINYNLLISKTRILMVLFHIRLMALTHILVLTHIMVLTCVTARD